VAHGIGRRCSNGCGSTPRASRQSVNYADYLLPTADTVPRIDIIHMESPTPNNPLGIRARAESGNHRRPRRDRVRHRGRAVATQRSASAIWPLTPARLRALIAASRHAFA